MKEFKTNIDNLISKVLEEEIQSRTIRISEQIEEELKGGQKKLDVAEPKGKLTAADFKKLRSKKKETKESHDDHVEDAELASLEEPTYVGKGLEDNKMKADLANKIFASSSDRHGWFDELDRPFKGDFDFDYDEETFDEFEPFYEKYGEKTKWFAPGDSGKKMFDLYKEKEGPLRVRRMRGLEEDAETEEGNAFTDKLRKTRKGEKFTLGGKQFTDNSNLDEAKKEKWIQKTDIKKGALHKKLGVPQDEKIPPSKLKSIKKDLMKKGEGDKKLSKSDSKLLKQVNLALTLKDIKESVNTLRLSENELVDMIEKIVLEQKVKDKAEKTNIKKSEALGLKKTVKAQDASKKENQKNQSEVSEKMNDYMKNMSKKKYDANPKTFPESNYTQGEMKEKTMKYHPSQAVDEYIEAFAYPGMTNIVYDEIKPDDKKIEKYIKGHRTTGNAVTDDDGNALGNVVASKVGDRFMKNYEDNLYGAEQMNTSYKRQPQPVDVGGTEKMAGSLKSLKKGSTAKTSKIMNQLESTSDKKSVKINEDISKMKTLISYSQKTQ